MNIHASAEDYLECILILENRLGRVRSIDIARELGFSKPSVSIAMKRLRENGYVNMDLDGFITLLPAGQEIASNTLGRHNLLKAMLCRLGVSPDKAEEDACRIEHVISQETYDRIRDFMSDCQV